MLTRVLSAAVNGIEAFSVEVEVNSGCDTGIVMLSCNLPLPSARRPALNEGALLRRDVDASLPLCIGGKEPPPPTGLKSGT
jgi:hypothetical protein